MASKTNKIKRYNLHLITPYKKNYEFDLLRFPDGEWCASKYLQLRPFPGMSPELEERVKREIERMKI